jgi:predicted metalloprotease with PDZ domain
MWRGGLSAPNSLYVHADRPLISENSTSTLLHEVMHSTLRLSAAEGYDWIVEGVAEFYSLELLRRSGTISESRFAKALDEQRSWSLSAGKLCRHSSQAATTALAVVTMSALSDEIHDRSAGEASLDDLVRALHEYDDAIDLSTLQAIAAQLGGDKSDVLDTDKLPGCRSIEPDGQETS